MKSIKHLACPVTSIIFIICRYCILTVIFTNIFTEMPQEVLEGGWKAGRRRLAFSGLLPGPVSVNPAASSPLQQSLVCVATPFVFFPNPQN